MKKTGLIILCVCALFVLSSCAESGDVTDKAYFCGRVVEIYEESCLVVVTDVGNGAFSVGAEAVIHTDTDGRFLVGDVVKIAFDGKVAQSYPPQVMNVYSVNICK